jgi:hypothetical protein
MSELSQTVRWDRGRIAVVVFLLVVTALGGWCRYHVRYDLGANFYAGKQTGIPQSDAECFSLHALNLISGRGFGDYIDGFRHESFVPPGHPIVMGFWYFFLGNHPLAVGWAIAVVSSLVPLFGYLLVRNMWGRGPGCVAAFLLAVHGPYVRLGFSPMSEPSAVATGAVALWLWTKVMRRPAVPIAVIAGIAAGFAALVRPSALTILTVMAPWLLALRSVPLKRRILVLAVFVATGLIPFGVWQVRNRIVHGEFGVSYTWNSVIHRWIGAHPEYGPDFYSRDVWHEVMWRDPYATEVQKIRRMEKETGEFIRADRPRYFFGCLWRMGLLYWCVPFHENLAWAFSGWFFASVYLLYVMAWIGLWKALRVSTRMESDGQTSVVPGPVWAGAFLTAIVSSVVGAGFYGASDRYRWPLEYMLFPLAGLGLYSLLRLAWDDLGALSEIRIADRPLPAWLRWIGGVAAGTGAVLVAVYVAGVVRAYRAQDPVERAPECTLAMVTNEIHKLGLDDEFNRQSPKWITFDMVFANEAENRGHPTTVKVTMPVWWGRVEYPQRVFGGRELAMVFVVNPKPHDFGGARMDITGNIPLHPEINWVKEGDLVTIIGRIDHSGGPRRAPTLDIMAILPGRFTPPEAAEVRPAP